MWLVFIVQCFLAFKNMTYRYNTFTKQCSRRSMFNETFTRLGVSSTAEFLDTFIIGTNADEKFGVAVNLWGDNGGRNGEFPCHACVFSVIMMLHSREGRHGVCGR